MQLDKKLLKKVMIFKIIYYLKLCVLTTTLNAYIFSKKQSYHKLTFKSLCINLLVKNLKAKISTSQIIYRKYLSSAHFIFQ